MPHKPSSGCLIGIVAVIVFSLLISWTAYTGYQQNKAIDSFTSAERADLGVALSDAETVRAVRERIRSFGRDAMAGNHASIVLTVSDLNDLIGTEEALIELRPMIAFTGVTENTVDARVSLPFNRLTLKSILGKGTYRYLNGTVRFKPYVRENHVLLEILKITPDTGEIPEPFMKFIRANLNIIAAYREHDRIGPVLERLAKIRLEDGKIWVEANS